MTDKQIIQEALDVVSPIPEDHWITGVLYDNQGGCCIWGHLGTRIPREHKARLITIVSENNMSLVYANDGYNQEGYPVFDQPTPKQRSIAALNYLLELI